MCDSTPTLKKNPTPRWGDVVESDEETNLPAWGEDDDALESADTQPSPAKSRSRSESPMRGPRTPDNRKGSKGGGGKDRNERGSGPRTPGSQVSTPVRSASQEAAEWPTEAPYSAYIGNLDVSCVEDDIDQFFVHYKCEVVDIRLIRDRQNQMLKGFGYVEFHDLWSLKEAVAQNGTEFVNRRKIRIDVAQEKQAKGFKPQTPQRGGSAEGRGGRTPNSRGNGASSSNSVDRQHDDCRDDDRGHRGGGGRGGGDRGGHDRHRGGGDRGGGDRGGHRGGGDRGGRQASRDSNDHDDSSASRDREAPRQSPIARSKSHDDREEQPSKAAAPEGRKKLALLPRGSSDTNLSSLTISSPAGSASTPEQGVKLDPFGGARPREEVLVERKKSEGVDELTASPKTDPSPGPSPNPSPGHNRSVGRGGSQKGRGGRRKGSGGSKDFNESDQSSPQRKLGAKGEFNDGTPHGTPKKSGSKDFENGQVTPTKKSGSDGKDGADGALKSPGGSMDPDGRASKVGRGGARRTSSPRQQKNDRILAPIPKDSNLTRSKQPSKPRNSDKQ